MTESERKMWLDGDDGLRPYLRLKDKGMPNEKVNQIAWLLLNGSGCGFCKVCRDDPCNIKDREKCTVNIANYIRECVRNEEFNNGWIPCSERLPEVFDNVFVCTKEGGRAIARRCPNQVAGRYYDLHSSAIENVIAWQPLPEPYKERVS